MKNHTPEYEYIRGEQQQGNIVVILLLVIIFEVGFLVGLLL